MLQPAINEINGYNLCTCRITYSCLNLGIVNAEDLLMMYTMHGYLIIKTYPYMSRHGTLLLLILWANKMHNIFVEEVEKEKSLNSLTRDKSHLDAQ